MKSWRSSFEHPSARWLEIGQWARSNTARDRYALEQACQPIAASYRRHVCLRVIDCLPASPLHHSQVASTWPSRAESHSMYYCCLCSFYADTIKIALHQYAYLPVTMIAVQNQENSETNKTWNSKLNQNVICIEWKYNYNNSNTNHLPERHSFPGFPEQNSTSQQILDCRSRRIYRSMVSIYSEIRFVRMACHCLCQNLYSDNQIMIISWSSHDHLIQLESIYLLLLNILPRGKAQMLTIWC